MSAFMTDAQDRDKLSLADCAYDASLRHQLIFTLRHLCPLDDVARISLMSISLPNDPLVHQLSLGSDNADLHKGRSFALPI